MQSPLASLHCLPQIQVLLRLKTKEFPMAFRRIICIVLFFMLLSGAPSARSSIVVEPFGFAMAVEEGGQEETALTLTNTSDEDITFEFSYELVEEDQLRFDPPRDELGDRLGAVRVQQGRWIGLAWDGERLWGSNQNDGWRMTPVTRDGQVGNILDPEVDNYYGTCWDGQTFWVAHYNNSQLAQIDVQGRLMSTIRLEAQPFGMTWDGENFWCAL